MQELITQVMSHIRGAWRFRWYALLVAWLVAIAGWAFVYSMPDQYQSSTRVYADTDSMLQPLLKGIAIRPNAQRRVQFVAQTLLSRPNLQRVARETELGLRASNPREMDELLDRVQSRIKIDGGGRQNLYRISFVDHDPKMSKAVVQSLLNIMMSSTLGDAMTSSGQAQDFLKQQVSEYRRRLKAAEQRRAEFRQAHLGLLPGEAGGGYFARLQSAKETLSNLNEELEIAKSRQQSIQTQLRQFNSGESRAVASPRIQSINEQIRNYRQKVNDLLLRYTPEYPDVIAYKGMIRQLEKKRQSIMEGGAPPGDGGTPTDNPVYQSIQTRLYQSNVKISTLTSKIDRQKKKIGQLKGKADEVTDLEAQLQGLNRDYSVTRSQYNQLRERLDKAQLSQSASHGGNNLKFRVIDPPVVPLIASGPPRGIYLSLVLLFSLGAGALFAFFLHQLRPVFMDRESLSNALGRPVLGVVSVAWSNTARTWMRAEFVSFGLGVLLLVLVFGGALAFQHQIAGMVQSLIPEGVV